MAIGLHESQQNSAEAFIDVSIEKDKMKVSLCFIKSINTQ